MSALLDARRGEDPCLFPYVHCRSRLSASRNIVWLLLSSIQGDFEAAAMHFNIEGQPQFAARSSMFASGRGSARRCQNES